MLASITRSCMGVHWTFWPIVVVALLRCRWFVSVRRRGGYAEVRTVFATTKHGFEQFLAKTHASLRFLFTKQLVNCTPLCVHLCGGPLVSSRGFPSIVRDFLL